LRAPDGCPWDREQTHATLRPYLIEESAEVLEAIDKGDVALLREELGDLMLQPVLHAQIAGEAGEFTLTQVLNELCDKLVRRHPHVFGEATACNSDDVRVHWEAIKKTEKGDGTAPASVLAETPPELSALLQALKICKTAARVGFEWPDSAGVVEKLREETDELAQALESESAARVEEELGDLLFTAVNLGRMQGINPELALRDQVQRFKKRFFHMEAAAAASHRKLDQLSPQEWEELWQEAKRNTPQE
jgi:MazG family protein